MAVELVKDGLPELAEIGLEWARTRAGEDSRLFLSLSRREAMPDEGEVEQVHPLLELLGRENIVWVDDDEAVKGMHHALAVASIVGSARVS